MEERRVEDRDMRKAGQRFVATRMPSTRGGLCEGGQAATSSSNLAISASSTSVGS